MCARASHDPAGTHSGRHSFRGCAASHSPSLRRPRCGSRDVNRAVTRAIDVRGRADAGWCFEWAGFASAPLSPLALFARLVLCCSFLVLSSALRPWHPALTPSLSLRSRRAARVPRALPAHPAVPARHHRVVPRAGVCFLSPLPRARSLWNAIGINRVDGRHGHPCGPCGSDVLGAPWERRCEHTAGRRWHAEFVDRKSRFLVSWWGECGHARRAPVPRRCLARRSGSIDGHAPYDLVLRASEAKRASSTLRCCKLNL